MTGLEVVKELGSYGLLLVLIAWLVKSLSLQVLSKDLEKYRSDLAAASDRELERLRTQLHMSAVERQVRFEHLHDRVAKVVGETYQKLYTASRALGRLKPGNLPAGWQGEEEELEKFNTAWDGFRDYYFPREIYFPNDVAQRVRQLSDVLKHAGSLHGQAIAAGSGDGGPEKRELFREAVNKHETEAQPLFYAIRQHFQGLIGAAPDPTDDQQKEMPSED